MTRDEMLCEMLRDRAGLCRRLSHEFGRWRRWLLKHKGMERYETGEWTAPQTKNRWLWGARLHDPKMETLGLMMGVLRWRQEGMEWLWLMPGNADWGGDQEGWMNQRLGYKDGVFEFTPHCWQRVRERASGMHRYYGAELVERMLLLADMKHFAVTDRPEAQNRTGQRLERPMQMVVDKGVFLGEWLSDRWLRLNTFIAHTQTHGEQQQVLGGLRQKIRDWEGE